MDNYNKNQRIKRQAMRLSQKNERINVLIEERDEAREELSKQLEHADYLQSQIDEIFTPEMVSAGLTDAKSIRDAALRVTGILNKWLKPENVHQQPEKKDYEFILAEVWESNGNWTYIAFAQYNEDYDCYEHEDGASFGGETNRVMFVSSPSKYVAWNVSFPID